MKSTFARNASDAVYNSPNVCAIKEKHRVTHRTRANRDTCAYARDSGQAVVGDKSPASVAGRRGAPPYDATRKGLGSENSALLTQRGRIPQRCCHLQLCWLACDGTTRAKATAFNVRRSYFGPITRAQRSPPFVTVRTCNQSAFALRASARQPSLRCAETEVLWLA